MNMEHRSKMDMTRRMFAALAAAGAMLQTASSVFAAPNGHHVSKVLFVCSAGTVKSAIARELFLKRARERNIPVDVFSRGIDPANHVSPLLASRLAERAINPARISVQRLAQSDLDIADIVVVFDTLPLGLTSMAALDWTAQPSFNDHFDIAWPWAAARIETLLDELQQQQQETHMDDLTRRNAVGGMAIGAAAPAAVAAIPTQSAAGSPAAVPTLRVRLPSGHCSSTRLSSTGCPKS